MHLRRRCHHQQRSEIQRVKQDRHGFVPSQHYENTVYPIRYLCHTGHGAPFRLDVVCVCVLAEAIGEVDGLDVGEDNESGGEVEFVVVGRQGFRRIGVDGIAIGRIDGEDLRIAGYEFKSLRPKNQYSC